MKKSERGRSSWRRDLGARNHGAALGGRKARSIEQKQEGSWWVCRPQPQPPSCPIKAPSPNYPARGAPRAIPGGAGPPRLPKGRASATLPDRIHPFPRRQRTKRCCSRKAPTPHSPDGLHLDGSQTAPLTVGKPRRGSHRSDPPIHLGRRRWDAVLQSAAEENLG
jgi:hypothetical protein